jgi:hypothetical protein
VSQKRSDQWSPDGGTTVPFATGIPLVAGTRYYFESVFHEGGGGDWTGVYYKYFEGADPTSGEPANVTSAVIGRLVAPTVSQPVITATKSGNNLNVTWTPTDGVLKSSTDVGAPMNTWTTLSQTNPAVIPIGTGNLFMRVQQ